MTSITTSLDKKSRLANFLVAIPVAGCNEFIHFFSSYSERECEKSSVALLKNLFCLTSSLRGNKWEIVEGAPLPKGVGWTTEAFRVVTGAPSMLDFKTSSLVMMKHSIPDALHRLLQIQ